MNDHLTALRTYDARAHASTPTVLLAPSTDTVFDWLAKNVCGAGCTLVGHTGLPGMQRPASLVATLLRDPASLPRRVILFTDQLASARDATVEVLRNSETVFLSPLEIILNNQYRCPLYAVNGGVLDYLRDASPILDVLKFTLEHLDAAKTMGENWLVREMQEDRTVQSRRALRRKYVRAMQSSILDVMGTQGAGGQPGVNDKLTSLNAMYARG